MNPLHGGWISAFVDGIAALEKAYRGRIIPVDATVVAQ